MEEDLRIPAPAPVARISGETVRDDFNAIRTVIHYTKAAHSLGMWKSERALVDRFFPDRNARLLEAGCGAGRVAVALRRIGYTRITAFDFASEMVEQAESLARESGLDGLTFLQADATRLHIGNALRFSAFDGALFMFNGLMQIPGRENRRAAMREIRALCRTGAHFLFTTHDRDDPREAKAWKREQARWRKGRQDPRLLEFGDRYFSDDTGNTFMHLPSRNEVMEDIVVTGWTFEYTAMRDELASETPMVRNFSDNCRFWVVRSEERPQTGDPEIETRA